MRTIFREFVWRKSTSTSVQIFRSLVAGGIAFLADVAILFLLTEQGGMHYLLSAAVGFLAGIIITYLISVFWVFHASRFRSRWTELGLFVLFGLFGLLLNELIMWMLTELVGIHYLFSKVIATIIVFFGNFFSRKLVLFH